MEGAVKIPSKVNGDIVPATSMTDRITRTELEADGKLIVYKSGEFKMPNGDIYQGETVNDRRQGRGTYYFDNGDVYVGEFQNGLFHGKGVLKMAPFRESGKLCDGRAYAGEWKNGLKHGNGKYHNGFGDFYDGEFKNDHYDGVGVLLYANGDQYEGGWQNGSWYGEGHIMYANGESYSGGFRNGAYHGHGSYRFGKNGGSYVGGWYMGKKHGIGKSLYSSGAEYEGEYVRGEKCGRGVYKSAIGDLYVGHFQNDRYHGMGVLILAVGDSYRGEFAGGVPCGTGRWQYERGGFYEGEFKALARTGLPYRPRRIRIKARFSQAERDFIKKRFGIEMPVPADEVPEKKTSKYDRVKRAQPDPEDTSSVPKRKDNDTFRTPLVVGSPEDVRYLASGGSEGIPSALRDGLRHGYGIRVYSSGARYEGQWYANQPQGFGVYIGVAPLYERYEGSWRNGVRSGRGVQSYGNDVGGSYTCPLGNVHPGTGRCFYDGSFENNAFHGVGTFTCCDGHQYSGEWSHGERHGIGRWVLLPRQHHMVSGRLSGELLSFDNALSKSSASGSTRKEIKKYHYKGPYGLTPQERVMEKEKEKQREKEKEKETEKKIFVGETELGRPNGSLLKTLSNIGSQSLNATELKTDSNDFAIVQLGNKSNTSIWAERMSLLKELEDAPLEADEDYLEPPSFDDKYRILVYEGFFRRGRRHGHGRILYNNGDVAEGNFLDGLLEGVATYRFASGVIRKARFEAGRRTKWIDDTGREVSVWKPQY